MIDDLSPQSVRRAVALTMADGRERTFEDVCHATHIKAEQIRAGLHWMHKRGLLTAELSKHSGPRIMIYCKSKETTNA